jgi:Lipopolysaccharide kinase (Kdo/WaaP) family
MRGFEERAGGGRFLLVAAAHRLAVETLGLPEPAAARRLLRGASAASGRAQTAVAALPGKDARLHLRPVRHGGLIGPLWRGALLGVRRPVRELEVVARLAAAGVAVPEPVFVAGWRVCGPFWNAIVGTTHVDDSVDGAVLLAETADPRRVLRAAAAAGRAVRRFHDAGGRHADLHIKNLLFRERGPETEAWIIDLDKARAGTPAGPRRRMQELMRLYRSLRKRRLLQRVGLRGCARFASAYCGGDRALRGALRRHATLERGRVALHALAYRR